MISRTFLSSFRKCIDNACHTKSSSSMLMIGVERPPYYSFLVSHRSHSLAILGPFTWICFRFLPGFLNLPIIPRMRACLAMASLTRTSAIMPLITIIWAGSILLRLEVRVVEVSGVKV